jgi:hypothetical protein
MKDFVNFFIMKKRPIPVIIVSVLFILAGASGLVYHFKEIHEPNAGYETILVFVIRLLAIVCGVLIFMAVRWSRWLAVAWLLYHVVLSAFHSVSETITHIVLLIIVTVLLFIPVSNAFFKKTERK